MFLLPVFTNCEELGIWTLAVEDFAALQRDKNGYC